MKDYMGFVGGMGNLMNSSDPTQAMSASDLGLNLSSNPNSGFFTTGAGGLNGNWTPNEKTQVTDELLLQLSAKGHQPRPF
jgi:hypothetical protein